MASSSLHDDSGVPPLHLLRELRGLIEDAVVSPVDRRVRAAVIADLIAEVVESLRWLHGADVDLDELASLQHIAAAARAHHARMAGLDLPTEVR